MKTWHAEMTIVAVVLLATVAMTGWEGKEVIAALAVLFTFGHASVADRLAEHNASNPQPVECVRWLNRYWIGKEILWTVFFVWSEAWAALTGVGVFLVFPFWRKWWRRHA